MMRRNKKEVACPQIKAGLGTAKEKNSFTGILIQAHHGAVTSMALQKHILPAKCCPPW